MNRITLFALFFIISLTAAAQTDTLLSKMPLVNGRLVYQDSIPVNGRTKSTLDSVAKKWFDGYFKYQRPDTLAADRDAEAVVAKQCATEFRIGTSSMALVKYDFFLIMSIRINCYNGAYHYKIFDIFFTPKSGLFRTVGYYQTSPEYMIDLLKKKHLGLTASVNMGRKKIREYLVDTNNAIQACIASLNKAMVN